MTSIPPNEEPRKRDTATKIVIITLKIIGVLVLLLLIAAGIILGTCMYGSRGR
jgi:hypothetical protein